MSYSPQCTSTEGFQPVHNAAVDAAAEAIHDTWAVTRAQQGWTFGPSRNDDFKHHPCLVPYDILDDNEKLFDKKTAEATIAALLSKGYDICAPAPPAPGGAQNAEAPSPKPPSAECLKAAAASYHPEAIDTSSLSPELRLAADSAAEAIHDSWAATRIAQGWQFGPKRDDNLLHHPGIVPYGDLTEEEKVYDRATAESTLAALISKGFTIFEKK